jgi:hypothetical protein
MSKPKVLFLLGIIITLLPFMGIPYLLKISLIIAAGLTVSLLSIFLHVERKAPVRRITRPRKKTSSNSEGENSSHTLDAQDYQIDSAEGLQ